MLILKAIALLANCLKIALVIGATKHYRNYVIDGKVAFPPPYVKSSITIGALTLALTHQTEPQLIWEMWLSPFLDATDEVKVRVQKDKKQIFQCLEILFHDS